MNNYLNLKNNLLQSCDNILAIDLEAVLDKTIKFVTSNVVEESEAEELLGFFLPATSAVLNNKELHSLVNVVVDTSKDIPLNKTPLSHVVSDGLLDMVENAEQMKEMLQEVVTGELAARTTQYVLHELTAGGELASPKTINNTVDLTSVDFTNVESCDSVVSQLETAIKTETQSLTGTGEKYVVLSPHALTVLVAGNSAAFKRDNTPPSPLDFLLTVKKVGTFDFGDDEVAVYLNAHLNKTANLLVGQKNKTTSLTVDILAAPVRNADEEKLFDIHTGTTLTVNSDSVRVIYGK